MKVVAGGAWKTATPKCVLQDGAWKPVVEVKVLRAGVWVATEEPATALIKGNADSGIYHLPSDPHYDETVAELWFETEAEAQAAGFRRDIA